MARAFTIAPHSTPLLSVPEDFGFQSAPVYRAKYSGAVRRRPTPRQGAALEVLAHAIEYLEDTNFHAHRSGDPALEEALQVLRRNSRAVFAECPEIVPASARIARWMQSHRSFGQHGGTLAESSARKA